MRLDLPCRRLLLLSSFLLSAACAPEGPKEELAATLERHIAELAPGAFEAGSALEVSVLSVDESEDGAVEVRFQAYDPRHANAHVDSLRGPTHTAWLAPEDGGYTIRRYGEDLARSVAVMIAADRRGRYEDLLVPLLTAKDSVRKAISDWAKPLREEFTARPTEARVEAIVAEMEGGVPAEALREGLASRWSPPEGLEWGVVDENPTNGAEVFYVRPVGREGEVCAFRVGSEDPEAPWDWVVEAFPTCRGRNGLYVEQYPPRTILEEVLTRQRSEAGESHGPSSRGTQ